MATRGKLYFKGQEQHFDIPEDWNLLAQAEPREACSVSDLKASVRKALENPIGMPGLKEVIPTENDVVIISENRDLLLPGMRADVSFTSEHAENVVLCPNEAIREGPGNELGVYVPDDEAPAEERKVKFVACKFGLDNGNYSEVIEGLEEDTVVYLRLPPQRDRDRERKKQRS